eukprot:3824571-Alexandrium_andersonii.AAC.1
MAGVVPRHACCSRTRGHTWRQAGVTRSSRCCIASGVMQGVARCRATLPPLVRVCAHVAAPLARWVAPWSLVLRLRPTAFGHCPCWALCVAG